MKKVLIIMAVVLMLGVNAYAAGDLTVAGKTKLGEQLLGASNYKLSIVTDPTETYIHPADGSIVNLDGVYIETSSDLGSGTALTISASGSGTGISVSAEDGYGLSVFSANGTALKFHSVNAVGAEITSEGSTAAKFVNGSSVIPVITTSGGPICIGACTPELGYGLYVAGSIWANDGPLTSDVKYKKNISSIESPLSKILSLKGVAYEWKTEKYKDKGFLEGKNYGVIAQEVEQVLPEIVKDGKESGKAVSYTQIIPVLIEAIKEQQKTINELKAQQTVAMEQQRTIADMSEKLAWLEKQMQFKNSVAMVDITQP